MVEAQAGITCPSCGHGNRPDRRYCGECGAQLATACGTCGRRNEPGEKFCGNCGTSLGRAAKPPARPSYPADVPRHLAEKIRTARPALEGERKQVTVLFADVKGSMELAEQLDPEEWSAIMSRFFQILATGVERFEGFVDKFTGDGIMALFGAPIAHEDHAQRACYAALHLRESLQAVATSCGALTASTSGSGSGSTRARSWSGRSAMTCAWTTRPRGTRWAWPSAWRRWPTPAASS